MEWEELLQRVRQEPHRFTKTGHFYFSDTVVLPFIEESTYAFLEGAELPRVPDIAILHIDRYGEEPRTLRGDIKDILMESGELV